MDYISNLITSIRNAEMVRHTELTVPNSKLSRAVLTVLQGKKYISSFKADDRTILIKLPQPVTVHHSRRISKPGRRVYVTSHNIPHILRGLGTVIISTSEGVMAGDEAHKRKVGGEVLCEIY
jgi:small subunit ribosomal protein S8